MEIEGREIRLSVKELEDIVKCFGTEKSNLFEYYKGSAGYEGFSNFETFTAYRCLCDDEHLLSIWGPQANGLLNESVYRSYTGRLTNYEAARLSLAETMKYYFIKKVEEKWTLEPISRELLKGAYEVVNWYELVDVLMEEFRPSLVAEPPNQENPSSNSNVVPLPPSPSSNLKRSKRSSS